MELTILVIISLLFFVAVGRLLFFDSFGDFLAAFIPGMIIRELLPMDRATVDHHWPGVKLLTLAGLSIAFGWQIHVHWGDAIAALAGGR